MGQWISYPFLWWRDKRIIITLWKEKQLKTWGDLPSLKLQWKLISKHLCKRLSRSIIIIIIIIIIGTCQRSKKCDGDTTCIWWTWSDSQTIGNEIGSGENMRTNQDHSELLRWVRILRRVLESCGGDLWLLRFQWKPTMFRWWEKLAIIMIIM